MEHRLENYDLTLPGSAFSLTLFLQNTLKIPTCLNQANQISLMVIKRQKQAQMYILEK